MAGLVARMREMTNAYIIRSEYRKEGDHLEYIGICGKIILQWTVKKYVGRLWTRTTWFRIGTIGADLTSGSIKDEEFDQPRDQIVSKKFVRTAAWKISGIARSDAQML
jgi:hypothetical protein